MTYKRSVVVVGAGVIGLSSALKLQESERYNVTVVAEHTPNEIVSGKRPSTDWASPWAAANWSPWSGNSDPLLQEKELDTYRELTDIVEQTSPDVIGIQRVHGVFYFENLEDKTQGQQKQRPWYADAVSGFHDIPAESLPNGVSYGIEYSTFTFNVPKYLVYLINRLTALGVRIVERRINNIGEAVEYGNNLGNNVQDINTTDNVIVVNCTGLGSLTLGGVTDKNMYPVRGQTIVVRAPGAKRTISRTGKLLIYVISRGDGTAVIGGTTEEHSWDSQPNNEITETILRRALGLEPALVQEDGGNLLEEDKMADLRSRIISVNVGFRPMREGGVRLEREAVSTEKHRNLQVVHCYGHGGFGYQSSLAYAKAVVDLVDDAIQKQ
ncbi:hypothetical protein H4217_006709 [Coemansia sp. RSA 1939]|nr:hypothetical protein H4217_006709 [Coemansia sp. RSA 1939]KAJ2616810.1 hypothetical protein EV177_000872 [Coemansia sp. RSA 1804]KAJ2692017.1 hypothetical protein GGH99_002008 [Coemansia sp. RSA 1285]